MKKLSQKGIAHHLLIVGIAVLVVAAVGFAGFRVYKGKNDTNAKAATYGDIGFGNVLRACKAPSPSGINHSIIKYRGVSPFNFSTPMSFQAGFSVIRKTMPAYGVVYGQTNTSANQLSFVWHTGAQSSGTISVSRSSLPNCG